MVEETGVPGEIHRLTPSHWQLSHMPALVPNLASGERQLAVSGNALDHSAGPPVIGLYCFLNAQTQASIYVLCSLLILQQLD